MCDDYRAAIEFDWKHDNKDHNRCLDIPTCLMWGKVGAMAKHYDIPATWKKVLANIHQAPIDGGHFFPDQYPRKLWLLYPRLLATISIKASKGHSPN